MLTTVPTPGRKAEELGSRCPRHHLPAGDRTCWAVLLAARAGGLQGVPEGGRVLGMVTGHKTQLTGSKDPLVQYSGRLGQARCARLSGTLSARL